MDRDEPGYWIGSCTVNLFVTEGVFAAAFVGGMLLTWPVVPWSGLGILSTTIAILTPVVAFPHSKLLYLALDLSLRPLDPDDLTTPVEQAVGSGE
jgi:hypothetical protein